MKADKSFPIIELNNGMLNIQLHSLAPGVLISFKDGLKLAKKIIQLSKNPQEAHETVTFAEENQPTPKAILAKATISSKTSQKKKKKKKKKLKGFMYRGGHSTYVVGPAGRSSAHKKTFEKPQFVPKTILRRLKSK